MIKVGLTGGIGSGKSTVCYIFSHRFKIPIFNSDLIAKEQHNKQEVKEAIAKVVGQDILVNGEIDNVKLAKIIFLDKAKLSEVSNIIVPEVMKVFETFCDVNKDHKYCIFESAIIFERNVAHLFDKIITVTADRETRINRVMKRNNISREDVIDRMNTQIDDAFKIGKSNFIIKNNDEDLISQVSHIHSELFYK